MRKAYDAGRRGEFSTPGLAPKRPPLKESLSGTAAGAEVIEREPTKWGDLAGSVPWLSDYLDPSEDAVVPRYMTGPHPRAVGTYAPDFLRFVADNPDLHPRRSEGLRWWQVVIAIRALEHDAEGRLVWRNVIVTCARQVGKSWLLRSLVMWRIQQRDLFGDEEQTVVSTAHKMGTTQEVFRPASRWALARKDQGWSVRAANGDEKITSPEGGRWLLQAANDGLSIGYSLSMLMCDESWKLKRQVVEAADAALLEAESPQLWLVSTAGDSDSDLFMTYRARALDELDEPDNTFIAEWSAPKETAIDDPVGWRMASPFWSERREREVRDKLFKLDELEFRQNLRNEWLDVAHSRRKATGDPVVSEAEWDDLRVERPTGPPAVVAVESWFVDGVAVASAWRGDDGSVVVSVDSYPAVAQAALAASLAGADQVLVGKSIVTDPEFAGLAITPHGSTSRSSLQDLRRLVDDGVLTHDGSPTLSEQVLNVRVTLGADGPRIVSQGRLNALKAAVWAAKNARSLVDEFPIF